MNALKHTSNLYHPHEHMHSQPFPLTHTHTHKHAAYCRYPSLLNAQHKLCEASTSVGAACQLELPLFRRRLFVRLKANVISDTQQEPSEHPADCSVAVMEKNKKGPDPPLNSSDSLSIKYPKRQMVMIGDLWQRPNGRDNEVMRGNEMWQGMMGRGPTYWASDTRERKTMTNHRTIETPWRENN